MVIKTCGRYLFPKLIKSDQKGSHQSPSTPSNQFPTPRLRRARCARGPFTLYIWFEVVDQHWVSNRVQPSCLRGPRRSRLQSELLFASFRAPCAENGPKHCKNKQKQQNLARYTCNTTQTAAHQFFGLTATVKNIGLRCVPVCR